MGKRLDHVVVGSQVEGAHLVAFAAASGEDDDRDLRISPSNLDDEIEPARRAQVEVDDRNAWIRSLEGLERLRRIDGPYRNETSLLHKEREQLNEVPLVVHKEDARSVRATIVVFLHRRLFPRPRGRGPPPLRFSCVSRAYKSAAERAAEQAAASPMTRQVVR